MLSIVKINSAVNQAKKGGDGYLFYLGAPSTRDRRDFDAYARGADASGLSSEPFWACSGPLSLGLSKSGPALAEHVERLSRGFHPLTAAPLVQGAGDAHVMGVDMTFSAPKDVSIVFAAADRETQGLIVDCLRSAVGAALAYAESGAVTRHGHGGWTKKQAEATVAACYTHFASRSGDPQLHVHAFMFNLGKRAGADEWSALEHKVQFERKMATGALFRAELAAGLAALGFDIQPNGPYFKIAGVTDEQRDALSTRSRQIAKAVEGQASSAAKDVAALNTRSSKIEPPLPELLRLFAEKTAALGMTPDVVARLRSQNPKPDRSANGALDAERFSIDHAGLLASIMKTQSLATPQDALAAICEAAMGKLTAEQCLDELARLMASDSVRVLGETETLAPVFSTQATMEMEAEVVKRARDGSADTRHRLPTALIDERFDALEAELKRKIGSDVSLAEQRAAALNIGCETGNHAFVEGWAGTGKTTLLRAVGEAYAKAGFAVFGCCQSASAARNLSRETAIRSSTIASFLLAAERGRLSLTERSIVVLDEAGMVGSREFALVQQAVARAGAKLIAVGDSKQLQPIEAGGIFRALAHEIGAAEISTIRRQRTDFEPLFAWLASRPRISSPSDRVDPGLLSPDRLDALRALPDDAKMIAVERLCSANDTLRRGYAAWKARFDHEWLRDAVKAFAVGAAPEAIRLLDSRGRLRLSDGPEATLNALVSEWMEDKTPLSSKAMIAGTRAEVASLNSLARARLSECGRISDKEGVDVRIKRRDGSEESRRIAPGERIVFTQNDPAFGVTNGSTASVIAVKTQLGGEAIFLVELDDLNSRGEKTIRIPASFGFFDHALCLTNHQAQGRTVDSVHALANPKMLDREWILVAMSRSRFATTLHVDRAAVSGADPESHLPDEARELDREAIIDALGRMASRSRAKPTTLNASASRAGNPLRATASRRSADRPPTPSATAVSLARAAPLRPRLSDRAKAAIRRLWARRSDELGREWEQRR
ncbi:MobF family relaxase [Caballeronia sp. BR00000012568055]|uniref:MobF family relaxase n=1 Tax=Caballeronia sp. BR00000012568055 TaxID=2918761 RepID=UPI0023F9EB64|nr:MobF family relaxase [Caballeronia sp. BR00000012568055]